MLHRIYKFSFLPPLGTPLPPTDILGKEKVSNNGIHVSILIFAPFNECVFFLQITLLGFGAVENVMISKLVFFSAQGKIMLVE